MAITKEIWFWQQIISPHMGVLAAALVRQAARVIYVAQSVMSADRAAQGWQPPELPGVDVRQVSTDADIQSLVAQAPAYAVHVCEGIRANGLVRAAQAALARRGRSFWVVMETVDDVGARGLAKRALYRWLFWRNRQLVQGVLSIGQQTPAWLLARGVPADKIFPFTYFLLDAAPITLPPVVDEADTICILFVGQLIERKRVDLLIAALAQLWIAQPHFMLQIIGAGPLERTLRAQAEQLMPQQVQWLGQLSMPEVRHRMAEADCLVLPSRHDGWGAVVSEALMAGTPAICSDHCGAAEVVLASGTGGVFASGDLTELATLLAARLTRGRQTAAERADLARWAQSLGAEAGACYLLEIFSYREAGGGRPSPPWRRDAGVCRKVKL